MFRFASRRKCPVSPDRYGLVYSPGLVLPRIWRISRFELPLQRCFLFPAFPARVPPSGGLFSFSAFQFFSFQVSALPPNQGKSNQIKPDETLPPLPASTYEPSPASRPPTPRPHPIKVNQTESNQVKPCSGSSMPSSQPRLARAPCPPCKNDHHLEQRARSSFNVMWHGSI